MKEGMCQKCGRELATYRVTATGEPFYAGVAEGKRAQVVLFVCAKCAASSPPNAKERLWL
jgi:hypothetical protein